MAVLPPAFGTSIAQSASPPVVVARYGAAVVSTVMLMGPALWNGFPLLQYDTGGYLARWYEHTLIISRAVPYGLLLNLGSYPDFWPVVLVQSAVTVWVLAVLLRAHRLDRPLILPVTAAVLSIATALPWISSVLLTDVFAGVSVLALYLVMLKAGSLTRWETIGLTLLAGYGAASHNATLAVLSGLVLVGAALRLAFRRLMPLAGVLCGVGALAAAVVMVFSADFAVTGRLAWTPGGYALSFGRMLQDGIVARYLAEHCPDPDLRLCRYRNELPKTADFFFWASDLFNRLGRFRGLDEEMKTIALRCVVAYPLEQLKSAGRDTALQLVSVRTGEGYVTSIWHTDSMIKLHVPEAVEDMKAARQQKGELDFTAINSVHVPVALTSLVLLFAVIALARRRAAYADLGVLAATVLLAVFGNAVVCGVFADPHDRYGARMIWLAVLVVAMVPWRATDRGMPPIFHHQS